MAVASWNIRHLGWDTELDYKTVAKVVSRFDLVAVQEVMDADAAVRLAETIEDVTSESWGVVTSGVIGADDGYQEGYAFLWNEDEVAYTGGAVVYRDPGDRFVRQPFSATFRDRDTGKTYVLGTVHILYGDSVEDRIPEIRSLDEYWQWLAESYPDAKRMLMGDFNLPAKHRAFDALDSMADNLIRKRTTLSGNTGYASRYDHIWVADDMASITESGVVDLLAMLPGGNDQIRDHVSDHAPVYVLVGQAQLERVPSTKSNGEQTVFDIAEGMWQDFTSEEAIDMVSNKLHEANETVESFVCGNSVIKQAGDTVQEFLCPDSTSETAR